MKTKINLLIVLMLVFAAFGQHTTVYAGGAQVFRLKGPTAIAPFISASGCSYTETAVMASVPRIRVDPVQPNHYHLLPSAYFNMTLAQTHCCILPMTTLLRGQARSFRSRA